MKACIRGYPVITTVLRVTTDDKALVIATVKWRLIINDAASMGK